MKTLKLLIAAVLTTVAINASAQIHLPPHPNGGPPPPPRLHLKTPHIKWPKIKHPPAHRKIVLHRPPAPGHLPPPPRRP
ncbi:MAG: hypothetical protein ABIN91_18185 [Mucilaginibacter sp.]|uniref:hypothetical protein n=1 Tax=Mucilaginibacter sp. TaxID=1882438 RepID=UPI0032675B4B